MNEASERSPVRALPVGILGILVFFLRALCEDFYGFYVQKLVDCRCARRAFKRFLVLQ